MLTAYNFQQVFSVKQLQILTYIRKTINNGWDQFVNQHYGG